MSDKALAVLRADFDKMDVDGNVHIDEDELKALYTAAYE